LNFDEIMILYRTIGGITNGNGFAYCGNNAVNFTDPDGYFKREMHFTQTYKWALLFLRDNTTRAFTDQKEREKLARALANANESVDKKWATSPLNIYSEAAQSWHFNTNDHKTGSKYKTDTRDDHYKKQKAKAEKLMKSGKYVEAIQELGKGLHALQDKITHTHGKNGTSKRTSITVSYKQPGGRGTNRIDTLVYFYWHGLGSGPDSYKEAKPKIGYLGCEKFRAAKKVTEEVLQLYVTIYKKKFG